MPDFGARERTGDRMSEQHDVPGVELLTASLVDLAVESWRFGSVFESVVRKLDAGESGRHSAQLSWFRGRLEAVLAGTGMRIVNVHGQPYDPGMAVTPLNIGEFRPEDALVVDQMLEPIIMGREGVVRTGSVNLRKAKS